MKKFLSIALITILVTEQSIAKMQPLESAVKRADLGAIERELEGSEFQSLLPKEKKEFLEQLLSLAQAEIEHRKQQSYRQGSSFMDSECLSTSDAIKLNGGLIVGMSLIPTGIALGLISPMGLVIRGTTALKTTAVLATAGFSLGTYLLGRKALNWTLDTYKKLYAARIAQSRELKEHIEYLANPTSQPDVELSAKRRKAIENAIDTANVKALKREMQSEEFDELSAADKKAHLLKLLTLTNDVIEKRTHQYMNNGQFIISDLQSLSLYNYVKYFLIKSFIIGALGSLTGGLNVTDIR